MKKSSPIRILIADDRYIVRMGLSAMVNTEPDKEVAAEATDGAQAITLFAKCNPDLAAMALRMPVKNEIEMAMEIRKQYSMARILILTALDGDERKGQRPGEQTNRGRFRHQRKPGQMAAQEHSGQVCMSRTGRRRWRWRFSGG